MKRERFKLVFMNKEVEILVDMMQKMVEETQEGTLINEHPLATSGFVLDVDDEFCYLGKTPTEFTKAIKFDYIVGVEIIKEKNPYDEILDDFSVEGQGN